MTKGRIERTGKPKTPQTIFGGRIKRVQTKTLEMALRAINNKFCAQIVDFLDKNGEKTVTEIYIHFRSEQSTVSHSLATLRWSNWVLGRRDGKYRRYSVNRQYLEKYAAFFESLEE